MARRRTRRDFLATAGKGLAVAGFPAIVPASVLGALAPGNRVNVGAIGTGRISRGHDLPGIWRHDVARIMAVCDLDSRRAQDAVTLVNGHYAETTGNEGVLPPGGVEGPGERWTYHPPRGHTVAWVAVHEGVLRTSSAIPSGEIAIFEPSEESIDFVAEGKTGFVLGSAAKHPHDLVLGNYSVHTSTEALREGEEEIRRIGQELRANGTLRR